MASFSASHRLRRFWNKLRVLGPREAFKSLRGIINFKFKPIYPLAGADPDLLFAVSTEAIRDQARRRRGLPKQAATTKDIGAHFPLEYENELGRMRYAFFTSLRPSKGLVVIFHGYLGFEIHSIRYSWQEFDILLPLDNFGWKGLGSWFWGEAGNNSTEKLVQGLIQHLRKERNAARWFVMGSSMGGFAALFHGMKHGAAGIYVTTPIIDLKPKVRAYQARGIETVYTALVEKGDRNLDHVPDIYIEAKKAATLPPLFLIQNQYDRSNPFGESTLPLLSIYDQKKAWMGLRVQPAIGHQGHDGSYEEAQFFFERIATKSPPRVVDFYDQES